jgi:hypothetical protein
MAPHNPLLMRAYAIFILCVCEPPRQQTWYQASNMLKEAKRRDPDFEKFKAAEVCVRIVLRAMCGLCSRDIFCLRVSPSHVPLLSRPLPRAGFFLPLGNGDAARKCPDAFELGAH